jgi:hypothetical protein
VEEGEIVDGSCLFERRTIEEEVGFSSRKGRSSEGGFEESSLAVIVSGC